MNNQTLVIYDFKILYEILKEIESILSFKLIDIAKNENNKLGSFNRKNYLIISSKEIKGNDNSIVIHDQPIEISKLIETLNIKFLKNKYSEQSEINLGNYKLNLNSRKIFSNEKVLNLTERESDIIIFLKNSKKPVNISILQSEVWGHNSKLETHTVETHIYRLRKKINTIFNDKSFIKSSKSGYII